MCTYSMNDLLTVKELAAVCGEHHSTMSRFLTVHSSEFPAVMIGTRRAWPVEQLMKIKEVKAAVRRGRPKKNKSDGVV